MRVAALYDIHGNLPALDAVLQDMPAVDAIVVGGDVLPGPLARETLDRLASLANVHYVMGNGDRAAIEEFPEVAGWPDTVTLDVDGLGPVLFCHGSPRSDTEMITALTPPARLEPMLAEVAEPVVVCGHTHIQFDRMIGDHRVVNAGSVGMPYEADPGAYWLQLGPEVELRHTEYDLPDIGSTGWPDEWPSATPEEATEFFERVSRERA